MGGVRVGKDGKMTSSCIDCLGRVAFREKVDPVTKKTLHGDFELRKDCHKKMRGEFFCVGWNATCNDKQMLNVSTNQTFRVRYASSGFTPALWSNVTDPMRMQMTRQ